MIDRGVEIPHEGAFSGTYVLMWYQCVHGGFTTPEPVLCGVCRALLRHCITLHHNTVVNWSEEPVLAVLCAYAVDKGQCKCPSM